MVEASSTNPEEWPTAKLTNIMLQFGAAQDEGKYLFIWDKQGNVGTFFGYQQYRTEVGPMVVKVAMGKWTSADIAESFRADLVKTMRSG